MVTNFYEILRDLKQFGQKTKPRGLEIVEIRNYVYTLPPRYRFMSFDNRKLNLDYIKQEFLWYVRGNRHDVSIKHIAKMWDGLINTDKTINSNYGFYIFNPAAGRHGLSNFDRVIDLLIHDPDTRRATVMILNNDHLNSDTKDFPCTYSLNFHIRDGQLDMYVRMRSQDAIYGMGNDAPCFSLVHELLWSRMIAFDRFKDLKLGLYHHSADSFHVYEKHYEMLERIIDHPVITIDHHKDCPAMVPSTHKNLVKINEALDLKRPFELYDDFSKWLVDRDNTDTLLSTEEL